MWILIARELPGHVCFADQQIDFCRFSDDLNISDDSFTSAVVFFEGSKVHPRGVLPDLFAGGLKNFQIQPGVTRQE